MCAKNIRQQEAILHAFCSYCKFCLLNKGHMNLFNWLVVRNNSENPEHTFTITKHLRMQNKIMV